MDLSDLIERTPVPVPWAEGEKIPWHEPGFSQRMLREHLSQAHDAASRRTQTIDQQVAWIHTQLMAGEPGRILDLGCGPGLYTSRLARLGHTCVGIDFGPAPIEALLGNCGFAQICCHSLQEAGGEWPGAFQIITARKP